MKHITVTAMKSLLLLLVVLVQSCSLFDTVSQPDQEVDQATRLAALTEWNIKGKVGLRQSNKAVTAAIKSWRQTDENYKIELSSTFFGLGAVELRGNDAYVLYFENGDGPYTSFEPDLLVEELLGYPLPLAHLPFWIKGMPSQEGEYLSVPGESGLIKTLQQHNWEIDYQSYIPVDALWLPNKLVLKQGDVSVKLVIKEWTIFEP